MFCKNCGNQLKDGVSFCSKCGTPVKPASASNQQSVYYSQTTQNQPMGAQQQPQQNTCPSCGALLPPGATFCKSCGIPLNTKRNFTGTSNDGMLPFSSNQIPNQNSSKKKFIIIGGIAAAAVLIGSVCLVSASGFIRRTFSSPEKYYSYVELKAMADGADTFSTIYDNLLETLENIDEGSHSEISVSLEDGGRSLLGSVTSEDISWIDTLSFNIDARSDGSSLGSEAEIYLNEEKLMTLHASADFDLQELYMTIPELSNTYIGMPFETESYDDYSGYSSDIPLSAYSDIYDIITDISDYCPDGKTAEKILNRYSEIIFTNIAEVEKSKETLEVGGISQKCTVLEASIKTEDLVSMGQELIDTLRDDKDIKNMIYAFAEDAVLFDTTGSTPDGDELYQQLLSSLDELEEELAYADEYSSDTLCTSKIWVGKSDQIVGRNFTTGSFNFSYARPEDGKSFALESSFATYDGTFSVSGFGKTSGSKENGTYVLSMNGMQLIGLELEDYDTKKAEDGYFSGTIILTPEDDFSALMYDYGEMSNIFSNYSIKMTLDTSDKESSADITILSSNVPMITLSVLSVLESKNSTDFPSGSADVYNMMNEADVMEYVSTINWDTLISSLEKANVPNEYIEQLEIMLSQIS